ncbi:MAG: FMN-binding protein [Blastocatellia bacterium]|nr:FMN-binding protein [Blastocatellia bacterium]
MNRRIFLKQVAIGTGTVLTGGSGISVFAQERKYLTAEQALKLIFPRSEKINREDKVLSETQAQAVERALQLRLSSHSFTFFRGETGGQTDGYAMIANEIGKEQYITFIVGISREFKLSRVALMVFRETRGWEVEDARFTDQFRNKSSRDRLLVGSDIVGITGATLSSRAFCRGAKKALLVCEACYRS